MGRGPSPRKQGGAYEVGHAQKRVFPTFPSRTKAPTKEKENQRKGTSLLGKKTSKTLKKNAGCRNFSKRTISHFNKNRKKGWEKWGMRKNGPRLSRRREIL